MQAGQPQSSSQSQSASGHGQSDSHTSHTAASGEKRSFISSWKYKPTIATAPKMNSMIGLFFMIIYLIKNYVVKSCMTRSIVNLNSILRGTDGLGTNVS